MVGEVANPILRTQKQESQKRLWVWIMSYSNKTGSTLDSKISVKVVSRFVAERPLDVRGKG